MSDLISIVIGVFRKHMWFHVDTENGARYWPNATLESLGITRELVKFKDSIMKPYQ